MIRLSRITRLIRQEFSLFVPLAGTTVGLRDALTAVRLLGNRGRWMRGKSIEEFEESAREFLGVRHVVSFLGGRVSLSAILEALDIGRGDEVILPGYTCVVVPNALLYRGIKPVYADIDLASFGIRPEEVKRLVTPRTRAIILQHSFGVMGDIDPIVKISKRHGLSIIEDCSHSLGSQYRGRHAGTVGVASFFSTEQSKVISTQMGGFAATNDDELGRSLREIQERSPYPAEDEVRRRLWQFVANYLMSRTRFTHSQALLGRFLLRIFTGSTGIDNTTRRELEARKPPEYGQRLPNALAALGIRQARSLPSVSHYRMQLASEYSTHLGNLTDVPPPMTRESAPVYVRYPVFVRDKNRFFRLCKDRGVRCGLWFTSVAHPEGSNLGALSYEPGQCPRGEFAVRHVANLPVPASGMDRDGFSRRVADVLAEAQRRNLLLALSQIPFDEPIEE